LLISFPIAVQLPKSSALNLEKKSSRVAFVSSARPLSAGGSVSFPVIQALPSARLSSGSMASTAEMASSVSRH
jgi:hypothetical protein